MSKTDTTNHEMDDSSNKVSKQHAIKNMNRDCTSNKSKYLLPQTIARLVIVNVDPVPNSKKSFIAGLMLGY